MTDKDLEEFKRWHSFTCYSDDELIRLRFLESWKAACEYKDRQLEQGMKGACPTCELVGELNEKLREALRFIRSSADCRNESETEQCSHIAEEALRGNGDL